MDRYITQSKILGEKFEVARSSSEPVAVIGLGGLGSLVGSYLAGAGINLLIFDGDIVVPRNLHRQIIYRDEQVGQRKAHLAKSFYEALNPHIKVDAVPENLSLENGRSLESCSLILDCTDNYASHYLIADLCEEFERPYIAASCEARRGFVGLFNYGLESPTYRALFPEVRFECGGCSQSGIIGPNVGIIASLQAQYALKYLAGEVQEKMVFMTDDELKYLNFKGRKLRELHTSDYYNKLSDQYLEKQGITWAEVPRNSQLVDVREFDEVKKSLITDMVVPLSVIREVSEASILPKLRLMPGVHYVLFCKSGLRSLRASRILDSFGLKTSYVLGGIEGR